MMKRFLVYLAISAVLVFGTVALLLAYIKGVI